jgi:hypothetical protein
MNTVHLASQAVELMLILSVATPAVGQQPEVAGRIKVASGAVSVVRAGSSLPVRVGQGVFEGDVFKTGPNGHLGVTLDDETRISLGPNSEFHLDRFVYSPAEGRLGLVLKIVHGIATYVSGRIARLSPDAVRLETPDAVVGTRGTRLAIRVTRP